MTEAVPLPEHLNECGCQFARMGVHLTTCRPAREHDATPLRDRPGYEEGRSYRAVSWQYPLNVSVRIDVDVDLDPVAFIAQRLKEYDAFDLEPGYEDWEKPMVFLSNLIEEEFDASGMTSFCGGRHVSRTSVVVDDFDEHPRWTPEDTERLDEALAAKRVDPDQGALPLDDEGVQG